MKQKKNISVCGCDQMVKKETVIRKLTNTHALVDHGHSPPSDSYNSFLEASSKLGLFPELFAQSIAPSTGERNIIVHEYELIDAAIIYSSIGETLQFYEAYIKHVNAYINQEPDPAQ